MKKLILSAFIAFGFLSFAIPASAQAYGTYAFCNGVWRPGSCGSQVVISEPRYYSGPTLPYGVSQGGTSQCAGITERLGRVIGANRGNDARNTENGGFVGFLVGNVFCPQPRVVIPAEERMIYERQRGYSARSGGYTRCTVRSGANGSEIRETINVATPEDCLKIGDIVDDAKQQVAERAPRKGPKPVSDVPRTQPDVKTYGKVAATHPGGGNCVARREDGEILADFLDAERNDKKLVVNSKAQCLQELEEFWKGTKSFTFKNREQS